MSVRFSISGFKFDGISNLVGSRDKRTLEQLLQQCAECFSDGTMKQQLHTVLQRAVMEGVPFEELDSESSIHIQAAAMLSKYDQEHVPTSIDGWKLNALENFENGLKNRLDAKGTELIRFLTVGRPIFGKRIEHTPQYYSYLLLPEIKGLRSYLKPYAPPKNKPVAPFDLEYMKRLISCGYEREVESINREHKYVEQSVSDLGDIEIALSRWLYELEIAGLDMWMFVT
jgi:hypothetical protein